MLKLFIPSMQAQQTPCVVTNTSSYGGLLNPSYQGFGSGVAYVASKHSVTIVTEALEHQLRTTEGNQITVHGLFPAMVETGFKDNALDNLGEGADEEALAQTDVSSQWCSHARPIHCSLTGLRPLTPAALCAPGTWGSRRPSWSICLRRGSSRASSTSAPVRISPPAPPARRCRC